MALLFLGLVMPQLHTCNKKWNSFCLSWNSCVLSHKPSWCSGSWNKYFCSFSYLVPRRQGQDCDSNSTHSYMLLQVTGLEFPNEHCPHRHPCAVHAKLSGGSVHCLLSQHAGGVAQTAWWIYSLCFPEPESQEILFRVYRVACPSGLETCSWFWSLAGAAVTCERDRCQECS